MVAGLRGEFCSLHKVCTVSNDWSVCIFPALTVNRVAVCTDNSKYSYYMKGQRCYTEVNCIVIKAQIVLTPSVIMTHCVE